MSESETHDPISEVISKRLSDMHKMFDFESLADIDELKSEIWASVFGFRTVVNCPGCEEKLYHDKFQPVRIDKSKKITPSNVIPLCGKCDKERGKEHLYTFLLGKKPAETETLFSRHASYYNYNIDKYKGAGGN